MNPRIVGTVRSHLSSREECPKYGDSSLPPVWIELNPLFEPAATDLQIGDAVIVLTWMHQGDQNVLRCHPMGNQELPMRGIFSTRSPDRPTPIGLHPVRIVGREGLRLKVHPLEVIDGTPVIPKYREVIPAQVLKDVDLQRLNSFSTRCCPSHAGSASR